MAAKIDYKKELETASRGMIMIHDPKLLIKMIVRTIVRKLEVRHAAMILFEPDEDAYILSISKGETGVKIPSGFTRFTHDCPIIKLFRDKKFKSLTADRNAMVIQDINRLIWKESVVKHSDGSEVVELLHKVSDQMDMLNSIVCVPAFCQGELLAVLLLGQKQDEEPYNQEELDFFAAIASDAAMAIRNAQLFDGLKKEAERNRQQFIQTIIVLGSAIEAKDQYTHGHTERVTRYALAIARQMADKGVHHFSDEFYENLYIGGLLHDIGKIGISEKILNKSASLSHEEFGIMKRHPSVGADMIGPLCLPEDCLHGILHHHERYDGSGYPQGLKGDLIPMSAAIISVADAYDAMTTDRPYRNGFSKSMALGELVNNSGTQFHPLPIQAMVDLYGHATGSLQSLISH